MEDLLGGRLIASVLYFAAPLLISLMVMAFAVNWIASKDAEERARPRRRADYAIEDAIAAVATASPDRRRLVLGLETLTLGRYVAGGWLDPVDVEDKLVVAATDAGIDAREALATIRRGLAVSVPNTGKETAR